MGEHFAAVIEKQISDLLDDADFIKVDRKMSRFNLFEAMGEVRRELKHSNFLAFLLSPSRAHGLGTVPLQKVLRAILTRIAPERRPIRALELVLGDLDGAIVHRELNNIDLLIEIKTLRLVVIIENKINAKVGVGQLAGYRETIKGKFPTYKLLCVFLTPDGIDPDENDFVSFSYSELARVVENLRADHSTDFGIDINIILNHYVEMLRRHIVPDEELCDLARQLYERHKEAFDFVFDSRENDGLLDYARMLFEACPLFVEDRSGGSILRFAPEKWQSLDALNACDSTSWIRTGRNLVFEIKAWSSGPYADRVILSLVSGPARQETREKLYAGAVQQADVFRGLVKPMGKQFSTIYLRELLNHTAAKTMNRDEKTATINQNWDDFLARDFSRLDEAIQSFVITDT
jgi:PD-(D/E)XK nuclease superfamily